MASFVGYARKHNPNPKTAAQDRESNHGGKLADDHFQRLFLSGVLKRATLTTAMTGAVFNVDGTVTYGTGEATVYEIRSDTVEGPPYGYSLGTKTIYNSRVATYPSGFNVAVVDTGRFYVSIDMLNPNNGVEAHKTTITTYNSDTTPRVLTTAEILGGVIQRTSGNAITFTLPDADDIVSSITAGIQAGSTIRFIICNGTSNTVTVGAGTGGTAVAALQPLNSLVSKEYTIVITNVDSGTEAYNVYEVSEE